MVKHSDLPALWCRICAALLGAEVHVHRIAERRAGVSGTSSSGERQQELQDKSKQEWRLEETCALLACIANCTGSHVCVIHGQVEWKQQRAVCTRVQRRAFAKFAHISAAYCGLCVHALQGVGCATRTAVTRHRQPRFHFAYLGFAVR